MRAIGASLTAAGLKAQVNQIHRMLDVTATCERPDGKAPTTST
jgi:hypothetical protein